MKISFYPESGVSFSGIQAPENQYPYSIIEFSVDTDKSLTQVAETLLCEYPYKAHIKDEQDSMGRLILDLPGVGTIFVSSLPSYSPSTLTELNTAIQAIKSQLVPVDCPKWVFETALGKAVYYSPTLSEASLKYHEDCRKERRSSLSTLDIVLKTIKIPSQQELLRQTQSV